MQRVQNKVNDQNSQEAFGKLSSLIDFYNKPANSQNDLSLDFPSPDATYDCIVSSVVQPEIRSTL